MVFEEAHVIGDASPPQATTSGERAFGEGNSVGGVLERQTIKAAESGSDAGIYIWSAAVAIWSVAGFETISTVTDKVANTGEKVSTGEWVFAGIELASVVPIAKIGKLLKPAKTAEQLAKPTAKAVGQAASEAVNTVYVSLDKAGKVQYVGITNNLGRRQAEHLRKTGMEIEKIKGLINLSKTDARAVEQVLINKYGLKKQGGQLQNKMNSISPKNPVYEESLIRGQELLKERAKKFNF